MPFETESSIVFVNDIQIYLGKESDGPKAIADDHGLWKFLMQLKDEFRPILILLYDDDSTKEISRVMRLPERMVKLRLSRAREK